MPTQEERLAAIEQNFARFQTDAIKAYQDVAMHVTITRGLAEATIGRLTAMQWLADQRFNAVDARLDRLETTLNDHTTLLNQILARLPENPS